MTDAAPTNEAPALTPQQLLLQRILKFVVIGLGILILVVLGLMVMAVINGDRKGHDVAPAESVTAVPALPPAEPFSHDIVIPAQAMVIETRVDGSTLLLRLSTADGGEEIMVIDMPTGAVKGRIGLAHAE